MKVAQSCLTLRPLGLQHARLPCILYLEILHHILEFAPNHVHQVSDAIQPSHPLFPPSPLALSLSQHQGLLQRVDSSQKVAKVLELQHQSFQ